MRTLEATYCIIAITRQFVLPLGAVCDESRKSMITMLVSLFREIASMTRSMRLEPYLYAGQGEGEEKEDALSLFHTPQTGCEHSTPPRRLCVANNRARVGGNGGLKLGRVVLV